MEYNEFVRNVYKSGLTLKEFAKLMKINPNSLTNYKNKNKVSKNLSVVAVLLGILVDKGIKRGEIEDIFRNTKLLSQQPRNMQPRFTVIE